jgi:predicted GNAT family acetyltransferase
MHLEGTGLAHKLLYECVRMMSIMFKITQNTIHQFSLAEILLMAALNEIEAMRLRIRASCPAWIN